MRYFRSRRRDFNDNKIWFAIAEIHSITTNLGPKIFHSRSMSKVETMRRQKYSKFDHQLATECVHAQHVLQHRLNRTHNFRIVCKPVLRRPLDSLWTTLFHFAGRRPRPPQKSPTEKNAEITCQCTCCWYGNYSFLSSNQFCLCFRFQIRCLLCFCNQKMSANKKAVCSRFFQSTELVCALSTSQQMGNLLSTCNGHWRRLSA